MRILRLFLLSGWISWGICCHSFAREESPLDWGWRFKLGEVPGGEQIVFNDAEWQKLTLPHCWGWKEAQQGNTNYYRGPGWYRRELNIGPPKAGRRYFLRFEAASSVADVFLNGKPLGHHRGAFGAFCLEITQRLSATGANLLALRVSNAPEPDVAPLSGDFCVFGGLYRPARLIETDENCFSLTDHASPGVAWLQTTVSKKRAILDVTAEISKGAKAPGTLAVVARVLDSEGRQVAGAEQTVFLTNSVTEAPVCLRVEAPKPHLWNGRLDPYLYKAVVELRSSNGCLDKVEQPLGLRSFFVDPQKGFFLNGKPYHLHGVDRHQDRPDKGWAISEADQDQDMSLLKEIGATVIRCAHYQHSDYFYSLCDRAGLLVWAEIPQVDEIGSAPQFAETSRNQLLDLIRQNVNHPSIFTWSLFNELRAGKPDPHRLLEDLRAVAHGEDPTRPTIAATMTGDLPLMNKIPDLLGWNQYAGWYPNRGSKDDWGRLLDDLRATSRQGGFCVSEYGAGANVLQHEQAPVQPVATNQWHPEEWQAVLHEAAWPAMRARPFVWGTFAWNMFDFTSARRHEGGSVGLNDKGLVTYDRQVKKDAFYFYKANWSDEPVLYITSRRFTERTNAVTEVKVYSNAGKAELFVNGASLGFRKPERDDIFIWKDVKLSPGKNQIEARASGKAGPLLDRCDWALTDGSAGWKTTK